MNQLIDPTQITKFNRQPALRHATMVGAHRANLPSAVYLSDWIVVQDELGRSSCDAHIDNYVLLISTVSPSSLVFPSGRGYVVYTETFFVGEESGERLEGASTPREKLEEHSNSYRAL